MKTYFAISYTIDQGSKCKRNIKSALIEKQTKSEYIGAAS
jgi:hypothetical protein